MTEHSLDLNVKPTLSSSLKERVIMYLLMHHFTRNIERMSLSGVCAANNKNLFATTECVINLHQKSYIDMFDTGVDKLLSITPKLSKKYQLLLRISETDKIPSCIACVEKCDQALINKSI